MIVAEGARNYGLLSIVLDDFFKTKLTLPSARDEQRAIGTLFFGLDELVTFHQRMLAAHGRAENATPCGTASLCQRPPS